MNYNDMKLFAIDIDKIKGNDIHYHISGTKKNPVILLYIPWKKDYNDIDDEEVGKLVKANYPNIFKYLDGKNKLHVGFYVDRELKFVSVLVNEKWEEKMKRC